MNYYRICPLIAPLLEFFISSLGFTTQKPILLNKLLQNIHKRVHTFDHFTIQVGAFFQCFFLPQFRLILKFKACYYFNIHCCKDYLLLIFLKFVLFKKFFFSIFINKSYYV